MNNNRECRLTREQRKTVVQVLHQAFEGTVKRVNGYLNLPRLLTFRTAETTAISFLSTLACAATVVVCIVCENHKKLETGRIHRDDDTCRSSSQPRENHEHYHHTFTCAGIKYCDTSTRNGE
jgi:hypothetical protein